MKYGKYMYKVEFSLAAVPKVDRGLASQLELYQLGALNQQPEGIEESLAGHNEWHLNYLRYLAKIISNITGYGDDCISCWSVVREPKLDMPRS